MRASDIARIILTLLLGVALTWGGVGFGCSSSLIQSLGGSANVPTTPGQNPYVMLRLVNAISVPPVTNPAGTTIPSGVGYLATWRYAGGQPDVWGVSGSGLQTSEDIGRLLPCNVTVVGLGDLNDPTADSAWLIYNGSVRQPIKPSTTVLQNGVDFRCGDVVSFITYNDPNDTRRYACDYQVQSGQNDTGPYDGPDTFKMFDDQSIAWASVFGP